MSSPVASTGVAAHTARFTETKARSGATRSAGPTPRSEAQARADLQRSLDFDNPRHAEIATTLLLDCFDGSRKTFDLSRLKGSEVLPRMNQNFAATLPAATWDALHAYSLAAGEGGITTVNLGGCDTRAAPDVRRLVIGLNKLPALAHLTLRAPTGPRLDLRELSADVTVRLGFEHGCATSRTVLAPYGMDIEAVPGSTDLGKVSVEPWRDGHAMPEVTLHGLVYMRRSDDLKSAIASRETGAELHRQVLRLNYNGKASFNSRGVVHRPDTLVWCRHLASEMARRWKAQLAAKHDGKSPPPGRFSMADFTSADRISRTIDGDLEFDEMAGIDRQSVATFRPEDLGRAMQDIAASLPGTGYASRVLLLETPTHAITVAIQRKVDDGKTEYVAMVFDPNRTATYARLAVSAPEKLRAYGLGDFVEARSMSDYFPTDLPIATLLSTDAPDAKSTTAQTRPLHGISELDKLQSEFLGRLLRDDRADELARAISAARRELGTDDRKDALALKGALTLDTGLSYHNGLGMAMAQRRNNAIGAYIAGVVSSGLGRDTSWQLLRREGHLQTAVQVGHAHPVEQFVRAVGSAGKRGHLSWDQTKDLLKDKRDNKGKPVLLRMVMSTTPGSPVSEDPNGALPFAYVKGVIDAELPLPRLQNLIESRSRSGLFKYTASELAMQAGHVRSVAGMMCAILESHLGEADKRTLVRAMKVKADDLVGALARRDDAGEPWLRRILAALPDSMDGPAQRARYGATVSAATESKAAKAASERDEAEILLSMATTGDSSDDDDAPDAGTSAPSPDEVMDIFSGAAEPAEPMDTASPKAVPPVDGTATDG